MEKIPPHPGEVLEKTYLEPLGVTHAALARHIRVSEKTVLEIVHGRRGISPRTAWLLAQAFGTEPAFWMQLQAAYSLAKAQPKKALQRLEKSVAQLTLLPLGPPR
jgi:addiction module HigA family antidote